MRATSCKRKSVKQAEHATAMAVKEKQFAEAMEAKTAAHAAVVGAKEAALEPTATAVEPIANHPVKPIVAAVATMSSRGMQLFRFCCACC